MIYKYYCMDCGVEHEGRDFNIDLSEVLGLRDASREDSLPIRNTEISIDQLRTLAKDSGEGKDLRDGEVSEIRISLFQFLDFMARSNGKLPDAEVEAMEEGWNYDGLFSTVELLFGTTDTAEAARNKTVNLADALQGRFILRTDAEYSDLHNYSAVFWVKPEFFKGTDEIYTIRYSNDKNSPNFKTLMYAGGEIRGYCPNKACGAPILKGTGKYPHIMVGMIGASSAGKTTTIVSMLEELRKNYDLLGVNLPEIDLADSKYGPRKKNLELYQKGWSVAKTDAESTEASFNASVLVDDPAGGMEDGECKAKKLLSLVDIAGELCWDNIRGIVNPNAWQNYPLINSCDAYILCTCMDAEGYGNGEGQGPEISPDAVLRICKSIYENRRPEKKGDVPPLCILLTKVDLAGSDDMGAAIDNYEIRSFQNIFPSDTDQYLYLDQFRQLKGFYKMYSEDNVRQPLEYCCRTYNAMRDRTYVTMLYCSAQGRNASLHPTDKGPIEKCPEGPFVRNQIDTLWSWIFRMVGVVAAGKPLKEDDEKGAWDSWSFRYVPSYSESYIKDGEEPDGNPRRVYEVEDSYDRIRGVQNLFLNLSETDQWVLDEWTEGDKRIFLRVTHPEDRIRKKL